MAEDDNPSESPREAIRRASRISDERDLVRGVVPPASTAEAAAPIAVPAQPDRPSGQPMHHEDRVFWVWLALWGAALVTTLGAGINLVFGGKAIPGWSLVLISFLGMALLRRWLINKKRVPAPFVIGGMIFLTWTFLAYGWLFNPLAVTVASTPSEPLSSPMLCSDGPCAPVHLKPGPRYVKEIGLGPGAGPEPLFLQATSIVTTDRLRVVVDYSEYRSGWMTKTRAFIGEIKEPVKGKTERLQLIYSAVKANGGTNNLWWGDPSQNHPVSESSFNGSPLPAIIVRGRVAIIGTSGEQHYYFTLLRGAENIGTQVGIIPEHDSGDWIESWEAD